MVLLHQSLCRMCGCARLFVPFAIADALSERDHHRTSAGLGLGWGDHQRRRRRLARDGDILWRRSLSVVLWEHHRPFRMLCGALDSLHRPTVSIALHTKRTSSLPGQIPQVSGHGVAVRIRHVRSVRRLHPALLSVRSERRLLTICGPSAPSHLLPGRWSDNERRHDE